MLGVVSCDQQVKNVERDSNRASAHATDGCARSETMRMHAIQCHPIVVGSNSLCKTREGFANAVSRRNRIFFFSCFDCSHTQTGASAFTVIMSQAAGIFERLRALHAEVEEREEQLTTLAAKATSNQQNAQHIVSSNHTHTLRQRAQRKAESRQARMLQIE